MLRLFLLGTLGISLPACLFLLGASWATMAAGIASWVVAVALKPLVYKLLTRINPWKTPASIAVQDGLASGALELGFGAIYLAYAWQTLSLLDVVAFGGAVAAWEVYFTIASGIYQVRQASAGKANDPSDKSSPTQTPPTEETTTSGWWVDNAWGVERWAAGIGHVGSRGMVYVAFATGFWWLALLAVALFGIVDGVTVYGIIKKWDWVSPSVAPKFYGLISAVGLVELALFLLLTP